MNEKKIMFRHPKSDKPHDFQSCFIWPQCIRAEYQRGLFSGYSGYSHVIFTGVELWFPYSELSELFDYPKDHEIGRTK